MSATDSNILTQDNEVETNMKAAFYGRFSTDLQNDESIEDQRWACQRHIESLGGTLLNDCEYIDLGITGQTLLQRPGIMALLEAIQNRNRKFDTIVARQLSRLSRDVGDSFTIYKMVKFFDLRLLTCDGFDSNSPQADFQLFMDSFSSAAFIKSVKHNVKISLLRKFENGFSTGGKTLGYISRPVHSPSPNIRRGHGKPIGYELIPDPTEVEIVQQLFVLAKQGLGQRKLTRAINQKFPGYNFSSTGTSRMLRNNLYIGLRTYNRLQVDINPLTGKTAFKKRPPDQWVTFHDPKLAIVDKDLFEAVQVILNRRKTGRTHAPPAAKFLLSDLLFCGSCGGSFAIADHDNYSCRSQFYGRGCDNNLRISRVAVETVIISELGRHLQEKVEELVPAMTQIIKTKQHDLSNKEARLRALQKEKENLLLFIRQEGLGQEAHSEIIQDINRTCQQLKELEQTPDIDPTDVEVRHDPSVVREFIRELPHALTENLVAGRALLRQILTKVTIHPGAPRPSRCPICKKKRVLNGKHTRMHGLSREQLIRRHPGAGFTRDCRLQLNFNPEGMMKECLSADLSITGSGKQQIVTLDPLLVAVTLSCTKRIEYIGGSTTNREKN